MFKNIGKNIKKLARIYFWISTILVIVLGIVLIVVGANMWEGGPIIALGVVTILVAPILAWLSTCLLYGFGELVDNSTVIKNHLVGADDFDTSDEVMFSVKRKATFEREKIEEYSDNASVSTEGGHGSVALPKCMCCGKEDETVTECVIKDFLGTRYRKLCAECCERNNAKPV